MTAVDDGTIPRNPCRIRGAGAEPTPERPTLTVDQVFELAAAVPERYAALVLVTTFGSLRWGEVTALRRCDVDIDTGVIRVRAALAERHGDPASAEVCRPLGDASATDPPLLAQHLAQFTVDDPEAIDLHGRQRRCCGSNFNWQAGGRWPPRSGLRLPRGCGIPKPLLAAQTVPRCDHVDGT
jgi:hypothetical protein